MENLPTMRRLLASINRNLRMDIYTLIEEDEQMFGQLNDYQHQYVSDHIEQLLHDTMFYTRTRLLQGINLNTIYTNNENHVDLSMIDPDFLHRFRISFKKLLSNARHITVITNNQPIGNIGLSAIVSEEERRREAIRNRIIRGRAMTEMA